MEYRIRKRAEECSTCGVGFTPGAPLYSVILLEEEEPARRDFCPTCFESAPRDPEREFAHWKTRHAGGEATRRAVDFDTLRELFFRMATNPGEEYRKLCYLLGLVLIRKRTIRLQEFVTERGRDYLVVTTKDRPEPLRLEAPELLPEEFAELREKLRMLLDLDLEPEGELGRGAAAGDEAGAATPEAEPANPAPDAG